MFITLKLNMRKTWFVQPNKFRLVMHRLIDQISEIGLTATFSQHR